MIIDNWKTYYKRWSVRLSVLGTALTTYILSSPEIVIQSWNLLPSEIRSAFGVDVLKYVGVALMVLSLVAGLIKQKALQKDDTK